MVLSQAQAEGARRGQARRGLGRSADADARRAAPARVHARGDPQRSASAIGVSTRDSVVDVSLLEHALREDLNARSPRVMAVLRPLKVVLENYPGGRGRRARRPVRPREARRAVAQGALSRELYIERDDFVEVPPKKWFRLAPGQRGAPPVRVPHHVQGGGEGRRRARSSSSAARGTRARAGGAGRRAQGEGDAPLGVRRAAPSPPRCASTTASFRWRTREKDKDVDYKTHLNPQSLEVLTGCRVEPSLANAKPLDRVQFERSGTSAWTRIDGGEARLQPDDRAAGLVGGAGGQGGLTARERGDSDGRTCARSSRASRPPQEIARLRSRTASASPARSPVATAGPPPGQAPLRTPPHSSSSGSPTRRAPHPTNVWCRFPCSAGFVCTARSGSSFSTA